MDTDIEVKCVINSDIDICYIKSMLPKCKSIITLAANTDGKSPRLQVRLLITAKTSDEILQWIKKFEEKMDTTYSIKSTDKCSGRYVTFKQRRYCQYNTHIHRLYGTSIPHNIRNSECPSKLTATLRAIKNRHRYKNEVDAPNADFPCQIDIIMTHNHSVGMTNSLKFHQVDEKVKNKLIDLYQSGHSPGSALEMIKMQIHLENDNCEKVLIDCKYCPDYQYCCDLYMQIFKKEYTPLELSKGLTVLLVNKMLDFNSENEEPCLKLFLKKNNYIICMCPPLVKRVHQNLESASEIVLLDSTSITELEESRIFILLTHSLCGALPLGIIITSSESIPLITKGLQMLQDLVGGSMFYGSRKGPCVFLTNDSTAERAALKNVWPQSTILLSTFSLLQAVWRWIIKRQNNIPRQKQILFFQQFKDILFSQTVTESSEKYKVARESASNFQSYCKFLDNYWARKELWVLCFRNELPIKSNNINNYSEVAIRLIKEKIFHRTKAFNLVQMVHFITTKFVDYYLVILLDAAHNRLAENILNKPIEPLPRGLLEKLQILEGNLTLVPSETQEDVFYTVNVDVLMCSCVQGNTGSLCNHTDWACCAVNCTKNLSVIDNIKVRRIFYKIATSIDSSPEQLEALISANENDDSDNMREDYQNDENTNMELYIASSAISDCVINNANEEGLILNGMKAIENLKQLFKEFLMKSPQELSPALETLFRQVNTFKTTSALASACFSFGKEFHRKSRLRGILMQSTAISRRKTSGRARKHSISKFSA